MSSQATTVTYLVEQMAEAGQIGSRAMFGEYGVYCDGKIVALVCDDQLFVKPTEAGRHYLKQPVEKPPYPGAKPYFWIDGEQWDDADWLSELIKVTAAELPAKVKKTKPLVLVPVPNY
jgi:DNA transformation protein